jgi:hypothetical protein
VTSILKPLVCGKKLLLGQVNASSSCFVQGLVRVVINAELVSPQLIKHQGMKKRVVEFIYMHL